MPVVATDRRLKRGKALILGAALKRPGASLADQQISAMWQVQASGQRSTEQSGLIIAPGNQPGPMQRHWHHQHVCLHQTAAGLRHPFRSRTHNIMPIPIFER